MTAGGDETMGCVGGGRTIKANWGLGVEVTARGQRYAMSVPRPKPRSLKQLTHFDQSSIRGTRSCACCPDSLWQARNVCQILIIFQSAAAVQSLVMSTRHCQMVTK
jgi:hypothetical protein